MQPLKGGARGEFYEQGGAKFAKAVFLPIGYFRGSLTFLTK